MRIKTKTSTIAAIPNNLTQRGVLGIDRRCTAPSDFADWSPDLLAIMCSSHSLGLPLSLDLSIQDVFVNPQWLD
jgi:hypothetical protein